MPDAIHLESDLERLIDAYSVSHVLEAIASVCRDKAEHVRTNWQDNVTAKSWDKAATLVELTADSVSTKASV